MRQNGIKGFRATTLVLAAVAAAGSGGWGSCGSSDAATDAGADGATRPDAKETSDAAHHSSGSHSVSSSGSGTGSSASSSSQTHGSSGTGSGDAGGGDAGGLAPGELAGGLGPMTALIVSGSTLYWIEGGTTIKSLPVSGGTPTVVFQDPNMESDNLASDGTHLYYTASVPNDAEPASEVDAVGLDGSNKTTVAGGFLSLLNGHATQMFVVGGALDLIGDIETGPNLGYVGVISVSTTGGMVAPAVPLTATVAAEADLLLADSSGLYFEVQGGTLGDQPAGGAAGVIYNGGLVEPGELTEVGGVAYFMADAIGSSTAGLFESSAGAQATMIASYMDENDCGLVADANGMYALVATGNANGIYSVDPTTGVQTPVSPGGNEFYRIDSQVFALDANNLYYTIESAGTQYELFALKR